MHYSDGAVNGKPYTGAVDISVRCLTEPQIRSLLEALANLGFAGSYRKPGHDDWKGPPHIHAVWAGAPLKPILRWQVESWLEGRNGLGPNRPYEFWQASAAAKNTVRQMYTTHNR